MNMASLKNFAYFVRIRLQNDHAMRAAAAGADAFLVSFPKSGRTWLRYLLSCYLAELSQAGFEPDLTSTFRILPNFDRDPMRGVEAFVGRRQGLPLILVSHLTYRKGRFPNRPTVLMVRDPRDVIVSAYFHATRHKHSFSLGMTEFLNDPKYGLHSLTSYLNGWANGLEHRPHHVVSYEKMLAAPEPAVADILTFLGIEVRPDLLSRAIATAQFDQMREKERDQGIPGHDYDRSDDQSLRMRNGKAGSFGEWLDTDQVGIIIEHCQRHLSTKAWALLEATGTDISDYAPAGRGGALSDIFTHPRRALG